MSLMGFNSSNYDLYIKVTKCNFKLIKFYFYIEIENENEDNLFYGCV